MDKYRFRINGADATGSTESKRETRLALVALGAAIALVTIFHAFELSSRLAQTSDSAQSFVVAHAVVGGNYLLSGWHFPVDDYYFTDTIPYAAMEWIAGSRPALLAAAPVLVYTLFVIAALVACLRPSQATKRNVSAIAIVSLLMAAPAWIGPWNPLLLSGMHMATVLGAFAALALCARVADATSPDVVTCLGLLLLVSVTVASDPFGLVFAYAPALTVLAVDSFRSSGSPHARRALLLLCAGIGLGFALSPSIAALGGFTTENDVATGFIAAPLLGHNLLSVIAGVATLFGITPALETGGSLLLLVVIRAVGLALVAVAVVRVAPRVLGRARLFDRLLCAGILVDIVACVTSTQFAKGIPANIWSGGPPMRFLMPAFLFGAVLAGRQIPLLVSAFPKRVRNMAMIALGSFAAVVVVAGDQLEGLDSNSRWIADNPPARVARWLALHDLSQGVGEYWSANLITAMSANRIQVRSVAPLDGKLLPYVWVEDARFYRRSPQFMIWQDANKTGVTLTLVRASYAVCEVTQIAGYEVAILAPACALANSSALGQHQT